MAEATDAKPAVAPRPSVLSLNINSKSALYAAYMPVLKNGGIFIPTTRSYNIGDARFSTLTANEAARSRALRQIAYDIRARLASYFAAAAGDGGTGGDTTGGDTAGGGGAAGGAASGSAAGGP